MAIIPQQYYVIKHIRKKYACGCKQTVKTAPAPKNPLPKSQASAQLLAHIMVSKYLDGIPLYRQEKIAQRAGFDLPRNKTARWLIDCKSILQPLYNLFQEQLLGYDIAQSDETGIQVLNEQGKSPESKSYLWIRRGGPPDKPVVLVDYSPSRSGEVALGLLSDFKGYLIADAYSGYNKVINRNGLKFVACNDHGRRRFIEVIENKKGAKNSKAFIAQRAVQFYKALYAIEKSIKGLSPEQKREMRQQKSVPIWNQFREWIDEVSRQGILHTGTQNAINYMLKNWEGLTRYCEDGRLPISNIRPYS